MPRTPRHIQNDLLDLLKPGLGEQRRELALDVVIVPPLLRALLQQVQPPKHDLGPPPRQRLLVLARRHRLQRQLGQLDPPARLQDAVGLREDLGKVADGEEHEADVDEVERVRPVQPLELEVVDLERQVRRHPLGLHGRDVGPDDFGGGVAVRHLHRPDACPRAQVEDLLRREGERGEV